MTLTAIFLIYPISVLVLATTLAPPGFRLVGSVVLVALVPIDLLASLSFGLQLQILSLICILGAEMVAVALGSLTWRDPPVGGRSS